MILSASRWIIEGMNVSLTDLSYLLSLWSSLQETLRSQEEINGGKKSTLGLGNSSPLREFQPVSLWLHSFISQSMPVCGLHSVDKFPSISKATAPHNHVTPTYDSKASRKKCFELELEYVIFIIWLEVGTIESDAITPLARYNGRHSHFVGANKNIFTRYSLRSFDEEFRTANPGRRGAYTRWSLNSAASTTFVIPENIRASGQPYGIPIKGPR